MSPPARPIDPTSRALIRTLYRLTVADQALSRTPAHEAPRFARRRAVVEALWDRAPFAPAPPTPVAEIAAADFTHDRFVGLSDDHRRPVVIRVSAPTASPCAAGAWRTSPSAVEAPG